MLRLKVRIDEGDVLTLSLWWWATSGLSPLSRWLLRGAMVVLYLDVGDTILEADTDIG